MSKSPSILSAIEKLRFLLTKQEKIKWLGILAFAVGSSFLEVVTASVIVIFAQVLNDPSAGKNYMLKLGFTADLSPGRMVFYMALFVGGIYLVKNIVAGVEVFFQNFTIQKMNYQFKNKLLHRYADADYATHLSRNASVGVSVMSDVELMFSSGMFSIAMIVSESFIFVCLIGMVIYINPPLALIIFTVTAALGVTIAKGLLPQFYRWGKQLQEANYWASLNLLQFFHGFKDIIILGKRDAFINVYQQHSLKKSRINAVQAATNTIPRLVIETLFIGIFVLTIAILCRDHESPVQMIGILGGYLYVGFRLMPGLNRILNQINLLKGAIPSVERVYNEYNLVGSKQKYVDIPDFAFEEALSVKDATFSYPNSKKDALKKVSFDIKKGESIGIVGETGSGKSTLVDVLLGLLRPYKGAVLVDKNYPVNSYQWHKKIGYVPQSIYLTDDTIEANIAFGEQEVDQVCLNRAIDDAQLRKFIDQLPEGSKTIVGERGVRLSGGERQRISIARALYRNPEVLIFDEATSALDNETEAKLMETINAVSQNRTVIMIAHRLTTLKDCDRIVVMESGEIKEITSYSSIKEVSIA